MKSIHTLLIALLLTAPEALLTDTAGASLSADAIQQLRTESTQRCDAFFRKQSGQPFAPAPIIKDWN